MNATAAAMRTQFDRAMALVAQIKHDKFYGWKPIPEDATAVRSTCLNCPPRSRRLSWRYSPHPGFGVISLLKDGKRIAGADEKGCLTTMRLWKELASGEPDHVWQIAVESPMTGVLYTRITHGEWIATHQNPGFA